ncbi:hypothetical protein PHLCEN_2v10470 [Hermanssonia centrifuga]|uniref:Uncharacterized protein n=1 Tax=Hermanssonia centrifuga TaxID=98765 RepID=A0A2R6NMD0_9APHY|nr:hypothetical protein PHLCEN_2v10470 [Hermanssonia centrifuga]
MGVQSMYTWLSPTGQAQHIKKILDETRVFMTQLKEQVPSGMVGEASNWTTIAVLEERLSDCEAQYKLLLEEIPKSGWAELYSILVGLRDLLKLCCTVRTDVLKTTNTVYKENKLRDQRQAVVEAQTRAQISEWMRSGLAPTRYAKVDGELKMKLDRRKVRVPVVGRRPGKRRFSFGCSAKE